MSKSFSAASDKSRLPEFYLSNHVMSDTRLPQIGPEAKEGDVMSKAARARLMNQVNRAAAGLAFFSPDAEKDERVASRMAAAGDLVRVCPRVYASPSDWEGLRPDAQHLWLARALQDKHPSWVFCGTTAALIHGLSVSYYQLDRIMLAVGPHGHSGRMGTLRRMETSASNVAAIDGLRVTPILQTVFDCMRWMPFSEGLVVADSALRAGLVEKDQLIEYVLSRGRGVRGAAQAYVCALHADGRAENGGESLSRATMLELGFACPELQVEVPNPLNPDHPYRLDFAWRLANGQLIGGEHDGFEKYTNMEMLAGGSTLDALVAERQRESYIAAAGIRVLRFTARQRCDKVYMWRLLSTYGVPWVGTPKEIASPRAAARLLARARQQRRNEQWIRNHLQGTLQMQLGSCLVNIEVIQGPWHRRSAGRRTKRPEAGNPAAADLLPGTVEKNLDK